jgi:hypothetical protein
MERVSDGIRDAEKDGPTFPHKGSLILGPIL